MDTLLQNKTLMLQFWRKMLEIRHFEQTIYRLYTEGKLPGFMHISIGQEAIPTGACAHLRQSDHITSTHRGHGDVIAKGAEIRRMLAELYARETGSCRAKGGSMHITEAGVGVLGANGIVAAGAPIAVGAALSARYLKEDRVVVCFFGDGSTANGAIHESLNMAALWKLPVIFVRQNNQYAESTPKEEYLGIPDVVEWARGYGLPAQQVDGNDVVAVYMAAGEAVQRARSGGGPSFIECITYRWFGHNIGDPGHGRPKEEVEAWKARCPVRRHRNRLMEAGVATAAELDAIEAEVTEFIAEGVAWAEASPHPTPERAFEDVYADPRYGRQAIFGG